MLARGNSRRQDCGDSANDSFRKCCSSESLTFGVGYICTAFGCRETCGDEPFCAKLPFSTEADAESEHGGAAFVTDIRRTLEPGVDGQRTPYTWKRECSSRLLESRRFIRMFLITRRKTSFLPPVAKACEKARLSRMN